MHNAPDLFQRFQAFVSEQNFLPAGSRLLLAFSGGRDSVCLAHLLRQAKIEFALAHVNYGLRGLESDGDEAFVKAIGKAWNVEVYITNENLLTKQNLQAKAREVRYAFFKKIKAEYRFDTIATAHHFDDHLETFFVQALRGGSIASLGGIPVRNGDIIRPLRFASRKDINAYLAEHSLESREDSSNASTDYLRNQVRHNLLPALLSAESGFHTNIDSVMQRLSEQSEATGALADSWLDKAGNIVLSGLPLTHTDFWLHEIVKRFGFTRTQCKNILEVSQPGKEVMTASHRLVHEGERLVLTSTESPEIPPVLVQKLGTFVHDRFSLKISNTACSPSANPMTVCLDADRFDLPITVRPWKAGDRFQPIGCAHEVKVKNYLTDKKVKKLAKAQTLVLEDEQGIFWIPGFTISERVKITPKTKHTRLLEFSYIRE